MCEKYEENDKLSQTEFIRLLEELERMYFVKVIQESSGGRFRGPKSEEDFKVLLKDLESSFRIIFYRKELCDIYDCLYYLKESGQLRKVCLCFLGVKDWLKL